MERIRVESSVLAAIGYDPAARAFEAEFHSGEVYRYGGVPENLFHQLRKAESVGTFYNQKIRNHFLFIRLPRTGSASSKTI